MCAAAVQEMSRAVGQLTKDNFLDLLKNDNENKKSSSTSSKAVEANKSSSKGWKALADDYYEGNKFNLKVTHCLRYHVWN